MSIRRTTFAGLAALAVAAWLPVLEAGPAAAVTNAASGPTCTGVIAGLSDYAGSGQVTKVGTAFSTPLAVEVVDTAGCPIANVDIEFVLPASGPSGYFPGNYITVTVATGSNGVATAPTLTANQVSGSFTVVAEEGLFETEFTLTNTTLGAASAVTVFSGTNQQAAVGQAFAEPLTVSVTDAYGDPISGTSVAFGIISTSGATATFSGGGTTATAQTNQEGIAVSPSLTAGDTTGTFTVTATVSGTATGSATGTGTTAATFTLTDVAGPPDTMTAGVGTGQSAELGTDFTIPLAVTVTDADSNPVAGATVTFSAPSSGASGVFAGAANTVKVLTNADGVATAPDFSANQKAGGYVVTATVGGLGTPATFAMVNEPRSTASAPGPDGSYWLVTSKGKVLRSGGAAGFGSVPGGKPSSPVVAMAAVPGGSGYWVVTKRGKVYAFGAAHLDKADFTGGVGAKPIVAMAATPDGKGYWLVASNGAVYNYGDALSYGSPAKLHLTKPIVAMAATPDGKGYWLVASDGGIFNYGDARYYGSTAKSHLTKPIVGMAATHDGEGYWLVASGGRVFNFGDASLYGSGTGLSPKPVVGLVPTADGAGYWLVSANGTAAGFGDAGAQGNATTKGVVGGAP